ncbi:MAG TPA: PrsW family glutamic-type intramembrane protease [Propionibacteriaceae bacterium]|nr:PrsW family glutamic-type intramembrane protease [Propionibacteriaceae bacterium]
MECPRCHQGLPDVAHFCHHCGQDLTTSDADRRTSFALKPDESVTSFALVSTIMPRGASTQPETYRLALEIALGLVAVAAILGAVPIAVALAAFAIPVVYIVYLYDVNLWEDEPVSVTGMAFLLTALLGGAWTVAWLALRGAQPIMGGGLSASGSTPTIAGFLIVGILAPVVGEAIRQLGPLFLASRPKFDDLMDGLTFGVISGVAYATADTLVKHWALITGGMATSADGATMLSLLVLEGFVKPLVLGTATGIACAEFSGLGEGYDGFTPRYFRGLGEAVAASVLYFSGTYLLSFIPNTTLGLVLSVAYGLVILGVLIIRVRTVLHAGLMEAALESQARNAGVGPDGALQFCPRCEMPLQPEAAFCGACGTSVRVGGHSHKGTAAAGVAPAVPAAPVQGGGNQ